jgi:hypothetical protein
MSPLYLVCGICGRRQAEGLLSRGHWGHVDVGPPHGTLQACPACKAQHSSDWQDRLIASAVDGGVTQSTPA